MVRPRTYRLEPEADADCRQPGNRLVSLFDNARLVGAGIVFETRLDGAGVLSIEQVDDLSVELPPACGTARAPGRAQIDAGKRWQPCAVEVANGTKIHFVDQPPDCCRRTSALSARFAGPLAPRACAPAPPCPP